MPFLKVVRMRQHLCLQRMAALKRFLLAERSGDCRRWRSKAWRRVRSSNSVTRVGRQLPLFKEACVDAEKPTVSDLVGTGPHSHHPSELWRLVTEL